MIQKVIKRDGRTVDFNFTKIEDSIRKAMTMTDKGVDAILAATIADRISNEGDAFMAVEEIQDRVEKGLMGVSRHDVAHTYISYRNKRTAVRREKMRKDKCSDENSIFTSRQRIRDCKTYLIANTDLMTDDEKSDLIDRLSKPEDDTSVFTSFYDDKTERNRRYNLFRTLLNPEVNGIDVKYIINEILNKPKETADYVNLLLEHDAFIDPERTSYSHMSKIFSKDFLKSKSTWNKNIKTAKDKSIERNKNKKVQAIQQDS